MRELLCAEAEQRGVHPLLWLLDLLATPDEVLLQRAYEDRQRDGKGSWRYQGKTYMAILRIKLDAALGLGPYMEPRLKQLEISGNPEKPLEMLVQQLSREEREARIAALLAKRVGPVLLAEGGVHAPESR